MVLTTINSENQRLDLKKGKNSIVAVFNKISLMPGTYRLSVVLRGKYTSNTIMDLNAGTFSVLEKEGRNRPNVGFFREKVTWKFKK